MMAEFRALCAELLDHAERAQSVAAQDLWFGDEDNGLFARARAALADEPAVPAPPADGEAAELAAWLYRLADQRTCNRRRGIRPHPSTLTRAAVLLQRQALVPVASE